MPNNKQWPEELTQKMLDMYFNGDSNQAIADEIGKSLASVKQALSKVRKERNLPHRDIKQIIANRGTCNKRMSEFDKAWHGSVPCGHWMITKPWRKVA